VTAPFAEYELTSAPALEPGEFECSLALGTRLVLDPREETNVSRRKTDTIWVKGSHPLFALGWGGTRNHTVRFSEGAWWVFDLGHGRPGLINGRRLNRHALQHGDRVEPAKGLVFTFFRRDDLEPLAEELSHQPEVFRASAAVLHDFLLERFARPDEARRVAMHLRYRRAHGGSL